MLPLVVLFCYIAAQTAPTGAPATAPTTTAIEECQNDRKRLYSCPLDRDRFAETKTMVVDLGVLAKADAFVGSLWSNVGRLAYELSAADKGCLPPLIYRDVGWCSVDGQLQDGTVYVHLNC